MDTRIRHHSNASYFHASDGRKHDYVLLANVAGTSLNVQLTVSASADLVHHGGLEIDHDAAGHMLASTSLGEEGVEGIITATDGLIGGHLTIRLDTMLQAEPHNGGHVEKHHGKKFKNNT